MQWRFSDFLHLHVVFGEIWQNNRFGIPLPDWRLPLMGNPGYVAAIGLTLKVICHILIFNFLSSVADPGGAEGAMPPPPSPVQISHKKDGRQRQPHGFHVSCPPSPLYPATGSDADPCRFLRYGLLFATWSSTILVCHTITDHMTLPHHVLLSYD